jgi:isochorismate pyruvate lyase
MRGLSADDCRDMSQVRDEIDSIDAMLVDLIAKRFTYINRASQIKQHPDDALIAWRIEDVVDKVRTRAAELGLPPDLVEPLWRLMMGWFVSYEKTQLALRCNGQPNSG